MASRTFIMLLTIGIYAATGSNILHKEKLPELVNNTYGDVISILLHQPPVEHNHYDEEQFIARGGPSNFHTSKRSPLLGLQQQLWPDEDQPWHVRCKVPTSTQYLSSQSYPLEHKELQTLNIVYSNIKQ